MRLLVAVLIVSCSSSWATKIAQRYVLPDPEEDEDLLKMLGTKIEAVKTGKDVLYVAVQAIHQNQEYFWHLLNLVGLEAPPEAKEYVDSLSDEQSNFRWNVPSAWRHFIEITFRKGSTFAKSFESIKLDEKKKTAWMAIKNISNTLEKEIIGLMKTVTGTSNRTNSYHYGEVKKEYVPILQTVDKTSKKQDHHLFDFTLSLTEVLQSEYRLAMRLSDHLKNYPSVYGIDLILAVHDLAKNIDHATDTRYYEAKQKMERTHKIVVKESIVNLMERIAKHLERIADHLVEISWTQLT